MENIIHINYEKIKSEIRTACTNSQRDPSNVQLIAVCKRQPISKIKQSIEAGIKNYGENRIQDAVNRWSKIKTENHQLSFIGPLQTNKSEEAVKLFNMVQSLDREKLANSLSKAQQKLKKNIEYMVQVNTGNEVQKSGIKPNEVDNFIRVCKDNYGLNIKGVMCIPPIDENPALHFAFLKKIYQRNKLDYLSMGMSSDFKTAIEFGATHIRIGSSLFGERLEMEEA
jgi:hypothetical protein